MNFEDVLKTCAVLIFRPSIYEAYQKECHRAASFPRDRFGRPAIRLGRPAISAAGFDAHMSALFDNQTNGKKIIETLPLYHGLRSVYEFVFKPFDFETKYVHNMLKKQGNKYYSAQADEYLARRKIMSATTKTVDKDAHVKE